MVQDATIEVAQTLGMYAAARGRSNLDGCVRKAGAALACCACRAPRRQPQSWAPAAARQPAAARLATPPPPSPRPRRSGDNPPAFALGQLSVLRGRYAVTYRLVNAVYVMVVAEQGANAFLCVQLLEAVTKILVAAGRGVDVTPDKIGRKYQEVGSGARARPASAAGLQTARCAAWAVVGGPEGAAEA